MDPKEKKEVNVTRKSLYRDSSEIALSCDLY